MYSWPSSRELQAKVCHGVILHYDKNCIVYKDSQTWPVQLSQHKFDPTLNIEPHQITENAISLIGVADGQYFHWPVEYVWHLYLHNLSDDDIKNCKIILRKTHNFSYNEQWIKIMFPFVKEDSFIFLENVKNINCINLLPAGRFCGKPLWPYYYTKTRFKSIRDAIIKNLDLSNTNPSSMLLIKRNHTRILKNWEEVYKICKKYCEEYNLKLEIFDDSKELGDVSSQLKKFNSAKIVVGCHGAGFTNIISCIEGTYLIEFSQITQREAGGIDGNHFKILAENIDLNYHCLDKTCDSGIDIKKFNDLLFNITKD